MPRWLNKFLLLTGILAIFGGPVFSGPFDLFYPTRSDWSASSGKVNISIFVFNDLNESGSYDLGDRAMAGVSTGMSRDGSPVSVARSNGNGFANYVSSTYLESAIVTAPGNYSFEVFTPPGWFVSTANRVQPRRVLALPGSPAGIVLSEALVPIGLARYKFIRGTYEMPNTGTLVLMQGNTEISRAELTPGEEFFWQVGRGNYTLVSAETRRPVRVGDHPVDIGTFSEATLAPTGGTMIGFEDMALGGLQKAPNGYGGLGWFNLNIMESNYTADNVGTVNGATSGHNIVYTSAGYPATISSNAGFDFLEVNLTLAWPRSESEPLVLAFYRGNELVLTDKIGLSAFGPITYQPMVSGVTRVELSTPHYWQVVLDDLVVNTD